MGKVSRRRIIDRCVVFVLLLGALVYSVYPVAGTLWNNYHIAQETRGNGHQYVPPPGGKDYSHVFDSAREYNENLPASVLTDPWTQDTPKTPEYHDYVKQMSDLETMGTVRVPTANITLPVRHGTDDQVLRKGAGHIYGTSLPVGGKGTHSAISAHSGLPAVSMFDSLENVKKGDVFFFDAFGRTLAYQVTSIDVVEPSDIGMLESRSNKDLMSLVTCTPYAINTHRLIVTGERIDWSPDSSKDSPGSLFDWTIQKWMIPWLCFSGIVLVIIVVTMGVWVRNDVRARKKWKD